MANASKSEIDVQCIQLAQTLSALDVSQASPEVRSELLKATWKFYRHTESPWDAIGRMFWTEVRSITQATSWIEDMLVHNS